MAEYLWDLDIEDIPCGFSSLYEEANIHFPDGKVINDIDILNDKPYSYWTNPVTVYNLIKITFDKLKSQAQQLMDDKLKYDSRTFMTKLIELDVSLYNLLFDWHFSSHPEENIFSDPYRYFNDKKYYNFVLYFSPSHTDFEKNYGRLRVIDIEFDFSSYINSIKSLQRT